MYSDHKGCAAIFFSILRILWGQLILFWFQLFAKTIEENKQRSSRIICLRDTVLFYYHQDQRPLVKDSSVDLWIREEEEEVLEQKQRESNTNQVTRRGIRRRRSEGGWRRRVCLIKDVKECGLHTLWSLLSNTILWQRFYNPADCQILPKWQIVLLFRRKKWQSWHIYTTKSAFWKSKQFDQADT